MLSVRLVQTHWLALLFLLALLMLSGCAGDRDAAESPEAGPTYVGSVNSDVYHDPECEWAQRIKADNLVRFDSPGEASSAGYRPCKVCRPPS